MTESSGKVFDAREHWETIYESKQLHELSWYQPEPASSLKLIRETNHSHAKSIIDVGGGDSLLADHLIQLGYIDITVLDISSKALERAQQRLAEKSKNVKWITTNVTDFQAPEPFDLWHDRATFHFLTTDAGVDKYVKIVNQSIKPGGYCIIGTFSTAGPVKCSGIKIRQYSEESMKALFHDRFKLIGCEYLDHTTPAGSVQNFIFCSFKKRT